jgi:hypothetical protein
MRRQLNRRRRPEGGIRLVEIPQRSEPFLIDSDAE